MKPDQLVLKCYAEKEETCWVALCLDFNLAVQGDSYEEVKTKLKSMIVDYVYDALEGDDKDYAPQLLTRRASYAFWIRYYWIKIKIALHTGVSHVFDAVMPIRLA